MCGMIIKNYKGYYVMEYIMGKIQGIFNFDNIGGKIKSIAKWSCWITILLIWIAAPIAFFLLVSDVWTAEFCWIPLVGAIVGPVLVWVESWVLYAFGEFVEKTADNENNTRQILKKLNEKSTRYKASAFFRLLQRLVYCL